MHTVLQRWWKDGGALSEPARRTLVRSLYNQPGSLAAGAIAGVAACGIAASITGSAALYGLTLALGLVGAGRVALAFGLSAHDSQASTAMLERSYLVGAYAYAGILGLSAAVAISNDSDGGVIGVMIINAVGFGVGACARNAGRPVIAIGQLILSLLPIAFASMSLGTIANVWIAVSVLLFIPAMATIVGTLFETLRGSILAAEKNAELAETMKVLARTDAVTGLANRTGFDHAIAERTAAADESTVMALFWLDLDRFKEVNDVLGHQVGDRVLAEVARRLRSAAPPNSLVARFGGDEFIVVCDAENRQSCEHLAARILDTVTRPLRLGNDVLEVPSSMGVALLPDDGVDADSLMQSADLALYHAKIGGKNHSRFYAPSMSRALLRRREIEAELRQAIQRDELSIFFQPIVDLQTGRIRTFEALVRWFHPQKGELKPDEFIPVAEETGVIVTLGNWITRQAARAAVHWPEDVSIAVNLSPVQIKAPGAALGILAALRESGLDPSRLELEVTESLFLEDNHATAAFISELSSVGVKFALDDFGTGYSSLAYIDKYPFHMIKVDRSFVSGPNVGRSSAAIIRAVAELGNQLGMAIVAEGIETVEQMGTVKDAGCRYGQGFYFSRAVPDYLAAMILAREREASGAGNAARANG